MPSAREMLDQQFEHWKTWDYIHQPAFDKAFADLTGTEPADDEWRRETRWNFTADDVSYTQ